MVVTRNSFEGDKILMYYWGATCVLVKAWYGHHIAHPITLLLAVKMLVAVWAKVSWM